MTNKTDELEVVAYRMKGSDGSWDLYYQNRGWKVKPESFEKLVRLEDAQAAVLSYKVAWERVCEAAQDQKNRITALEAALEVARKAMNKAAVWADGSAEDGLYHSIAAIDALIDTTPKETL